MQCKSRPESGWKNLFLATVTDPLTPPSKDIQACFPSSLSTTTPPSPPRLTLPPHSWSLSAASVLSCLEGPQTTDYKLVKKKEGNWFKEKSVLNQCFFVSGVWGEHISNAVWPSVPIPGQEAQSQAAPQASQVTLNPLLGGTIFHLELSCLRPDVSLS